MIGTMFFHNIKLTCNLPVALSMESSSLEDWLPVIIVSVFNAGDTLGRLVS